MQITDIAPVIALIGVAMAMLLLTLEPAIARYRLSWTAPAGLSALFSFWTALAVATEGPAAFWSVHTQGYWGNQVWFDLLFFAATGWALMVPRARGAGMRPAMWLLPVLATGSVASLAMLARLLYLEARVERTAHGSCRDRQGPAPS